MLKKIIIIILKKKCRYDVRVRCGTVSTYHVKVVGRWEYDKWCAESAEFYSFL